MLISELAKKTGISIHTIRYYEKNKLLRPILRKNNNYKEYPEDSIKYLSFIKKVQNLGFSLKEIREVLEIFQKPTKSDLIHKKISNKLVEVEDKMKELKEVKSILHKILLLCEENRSQVKDLQYLFDKIQFF